jgi:hypothetical protein
MVCMEEICWTSSCSTFSNTRVRRKHEVYDRLLTGTQVDFQ